MLSKIIRSWKTISLLLGCSAFFISSVQSQEIDPKVEDILKSVSEYYQSLDSFSVSTSSKQIINAQHSETNQLQREATIDYKLALKRPNLFSVVMTDTEGEGLFIGGTFVNNKENAIAYHPQFNAYVKEESIATIQQIWNEFQSNENFKFVLGPANNQIPINLIMAPDGYEKFTRNLSSSKYLGTEDVGDQSAEKVQLSGQGITWTLWIDKSDTPKLLKSRLDMSEMLEQQLANRGFTIKQADFTTEYKKWVLKDKISDDLFTYTPPTAAKEADSFREILSQRQQEEQSSPLEGKPAPDFTLSKLDGGEFTLSSQKGENVVVLDFWATWCGPCRKAMPILENVVHDFKGKDVTLIAVNQREDKETIQSFLQQQDLDPTVVLDKTGTVGQKYQVGGIPQFVVIGKDGIVKKVIVGIAPNFEQQIKSLINSLL